ncbi:MAG: MBL fold metallo-hydrolase, partial [Betaproteobacteria bacterium]|nr:MBL fold metallo-hydrolase [Betaproteobacteria bacterium]
ADGFGVIFPELEGESGFEEQAAMLDLIEYLQPRWVFPGHGPAFSDVDQALSSARERLAAMRVNPAKHAGHALKVLLKFLMLDLEWTHKDALKTHLAQAKLLAACAQRMQMQADEALQWAIDALLAQGHLRAEGPMLRNH